MVIFILKGYFSVCFLEFGRGLNTIRLKSGSSRMASFYTGASNDGFKGWGGMFRPVGFTALSAKNGKKKLQASYLQLSKLVTK